MESIMGQPYTITQLVDLLKERITEDPEKAQQQLHNILIQTAGNIDRANPNKEEVMAMKAIALTLTKSTSNLSLDQPPYSAPADVMVLNSNFQKIDDYAATTNAALDQKVNNFEIIYTGSVHQLLDKPSGFYCVQAAVTDMPSSSIWFVIAASIVEAPSDNDCWLMANSFYTGETYQKGCVNGVWGAWKKFTLT